MPGKPNIPCVCETCGVSFLAYARFVREGGGRFCSRQCSAIPRRGHGVIRICEHCGTSFDVQPFFANRRYCSKRCQLLPRELIPDPDDPTAMLVPLPNSEFAIIDAADAPLVSWANWSASGKGVRYAVTVVKKNGKNRYLRMHGVILGLTDERLTDHKDGNGLNNRRSNLRPATTHENAANRIRQNISASGFKGVHWDERTGRIYAYVKKHGKTTYLGYFTTREEAALVYDEAAREFHG